MRGIIIRWCSKVKKILGNMLKVGLMESDLFLIELLVFIANRYKWISGIDIFNWTTLILHNIL